MNITLIKNSDIDDIIDLIKFNYNRMNNKNLIHCDNYLDEDKLREIINNDGFGIKCLDGNRTVGISFVLFYDKSKDLYENDPFNNLEDKNNDKIAIMDFQMVDESYRGRNIQKKLLEECETKSKILGYDLAVNITNSENIYSLNNFLSMDYHKNKVLDNFYNRSLSYYLLMKKL